MEFLFLTDLFLFLGHTFFFSFCLLFLFLSHSPPSVLDLCLCAYCFEEVY